MIAPPCHAGVHIRTARRAERRRRARSGRAGDLPALRAMPGAGASPAKLYPGAHVVVARAVYR